MAKRGNGEGSIQHFNNNWVAKTQIGWLDNGKPKIKSFSATTRAGALRRMNEYKRLLEHNIDIDAGSGTLYECMSKWLLEYKSLELKDSSYTRLEHTIVNNIKPYIGQYNVKEITSAIVQTKLINVLFDNGLSYSTIKKAYHALNAYYKKLIAEGQILRNPMLGVNLPSAKKFEVSNSSIKVLSEIEIKQFKLQATKMNNSGGYIYRYGFAFVFILYTGLRCGEALGLQWKHIDIEKKLVKIEQNVVTVKNREDAGTKYVAKLQNSTKTINGMREIPLCKQAIEAITIYKELFYKGNDDDFVITTKKINLLCTRHFERSINYIYNAASINTSGLHILRHTFASMLFSKNVEIKYISKLLGHGDVSTTYNIYVHLNKSQEIDAIDKLDEL